MWLRRVLGRSWRWFCRDHRAGAAGRRSVQGRVLAWCRHKGRCPHAFAPDSFVRPLLYPRERGDDPAWYVWSPSMDRADRGFSGGALGLGVLALCTAADMAARFWPWGFFWLSPAHLVELLTPPPFSPVAGRHAIPLPRDLHATVDQHRTAIVTRRVTPTAALHLPPLPQGFGSLARPPVFLNGGLRSVSPTPHQWKSILWAGHRTDAKVPFLAAAFIEGRR